MFRRYLLIFIKNKNWKLFSRLKMDHEFFCGNRSDSKLLYVLSEKQIYKKNTKTLKHMVYRCYIEGCKSRVLVNGNECQQVSDFKEHSHSENQEKTYKQMKVKSEIKAGCSSTLALSSSSCVGSVRTLFNDVCRT